MLVSTGCIFSTHHLRSTSMEHAAPKPVILGGGIRPNALEYSGDINRRLTLERVRYGARVAKGCRVAVLVAGGSVGLREKQKQN
ncbi:MAG: hypothetical protein IPP36_13670 [Nitrosomonadales bacterium]|nr:hypothetical protein [Nitrosomonadales bacterium]